MKSKIPLLIISPQEEYKELRLQLSDLGRKKQKIRRRLTILMELIHRQKSRSLPQ